MSYPSTIRTTATNGDSMSLLESETNQNSNANASTAGGVATLDQPSADVTCTNCGSCESWGQSTFCPLCGYYPTLGSCVDVSAPEYAEPQAATFSDVIPVWVWGMVAGVVAVLGWSLYANATLPAEGSKRLFWSLAQMGIGAIAIAVGHIAAFTTALVASDKVAPFDFLMKPIETWKPTFTRLPKNVWTVYVAAWGIASILFAALVVGGIPYTELFDSFGPKEAPKNSIVSAVVSQARTERETDMDMEEAMNAFVGDATGDLEKTNDEKEKEALAKMMTADCLIAGFVPNPDGSINRLLIAAVVKQRLRYVGQINGSQLRDEDKQALISRFPKLKRSTPFVKCNTAGLWLQPVLMCRVKYDKLNSRNQMRTIKFIELLADVESN